MRIFADKLADHLNKPLMGLYLLFGNEPLLLQESRVAIEKKALEQGFEERHRFSADAHLNWDQVYDCCQALSLFSSKKIIEIELPETGANAATAKELVALGQSLHPDVLLVIIGEKLTKAQESTKWFKTLSSLGCWVSCLTPDISKLPQFVMMRCRALGLKPDQEAVQMLAQWHEGNLFALSQSLEKLALLYPDGLLTLIRLEESLSRHNHFTVFHWVDALLEGQANRSQRIFRQLITEGTEPVILIRSLQKELLLLLQMHQDLTQMPIGSIFDKYRIWQSKRPWYAASLKRLSRDKLKQLIALLTQAERVTKTQYETSTWPILQQISVEFCLPQSVVSKLA
ncbi:DNA polymerase III subunit delta [Vibrio anguillarum]|uniref:DNA polymerase III subunit delta n=1 Tax=Vibrio anguillarum TaxID=55601 RepID=A0ABD4QVV2_VIBAN|nr:DNA polymerase III subunit delta [Vibrio anguillarum]MBT2919155.1 DNA polymerase III subunit delta [Vibrio anguillarum]